MSNRLAILIPTIVGREAMLQRLLDILVPQREKYRREQGDIMDIIIINDHPRAELKKTIGEKRNILTQLAIERGFSHRAFIDDDDTVTDDYLDLNMPGVLQDFDCNSLVGIYSLNGVTNPHKHIFIHSLKYDSWWEDGQGYYRNPNHLNVCSLAKIGHIKFPESNFGEDGQWSERIHAAGCLKTEYEITKPFYNYLDRTKVNGI